MARRRDFSTTAGSSYLPLVLCLAALAHTAAREQPTARNRGVLRPQALARREPPPTPAAVLLESGGAMMKAESTAKVNVMSAGSPGYNQEDLSTKICNFDFVIGQFGIIECPETEHRHIGNEAVCKQAALVRGVQANQTGFRKDPSEWASHPPGCFQAQCGADDPKLGIFATDDCMFFNPHTGDDFPPCHTEASCEGSVVCTRSKFARAPDPANASDASTCPSGFSKIEEQNLCSAAGQCLNINSGPPTATMTNLVQTEPSAFPHGCFVIPEDAPGVPCCFYFNHQHVPSDPEKAGQHVPRHMCVVDGAVR